MQRISQILGIGQSLWYDNIQRSLLKNGYLKKMISNGMIRGVTSNPSIFHKAITESQDYDDDIMPLSLAGFTADEIFWRMAIKDIQETADLLLPLYRESNLLDGYVSLEVNPVYARDPGKTVEEAKRLWKLVDRPNLMVKIPATNEGLSAIKSAISMGININVTLIFSQARYLEVVDAYLSGLEDRVKKGLDVSGVASVASFFVSRLDTKIDSNLERLVEKGKISTEERNSLTGKAAIANTKLAYRLFESMFSSERFIVLRIHGAQIQRPLWASTSTKNLHYRDVIYVEELIGKNTVNTVPPATLDAFFHHGLVKSTLSRNLEQAEAHLLALKKAGVSLEQMTDSLEREGIQAFNTSFSDLMKAIETRRIKVIRRIGGLANNARQQINKLEKRSYAQRLLDKDGSLWTDDDAGQKEAQQRLDWVFAPQTGRLLIPALEALKKECKILGYLHVVLLGMGGSSLAPEVLSLIHGRNSILGNPGLEIHILDSTDPLEVLAVRSKITLQKTLFIVASKSGTTGEINAFLDFFWEACIKEFGKDAGQHFIAITDPGTHLEEIAREKSFLRVFYGDPMVGGRNSALTAFGLVPAALIGMDVSRLLDSAQYMADLCMPSNQQGANPGIALGAVLGAAALSKRDKLTILTDEDWISFGAWLEQLIAESSGKNGKGIIPIVCEPQIIPTLYDSDRMFIYVRSTGQKNGLVEKLQENGHPILVVDVNDQYDLGSQFYLWEYATAAACAILEVNSFDQPDVQDAKIRTIEGLADFRQNGKLMEPENKVHVGNAFVYSPGQEISENYSLKETINQFLNENLKDGDYFAINAFLPRDEKSEESLQKMRERVLIKYHTATTLGFGPRFLHSTGQLHKGGSNKGVFLVITSRREKDLAIPTQGITFGLMQRAQALGDLLVLEAKGRRVMWVDLDQPDANYLIQ